MTSAGKMTSMKPLVKASSEPVANGPATLLGDLTSPAMASSGSKNPTAVPGFPPGLWSLVIRVSAEDSVGCTATRHIRTTPRIHNGENALRLDEIMMVSPVEE